MRYSKTLFPAAVLAVAATVTGLACNNTSEDAEAQAGTAQSAVKPGNNGTVKIQEADATDEIPDNDPHVGCKFKIEFRGFDAGDLNATWTLSAHPPSGREIASGTTFIGEDPATEGAIDLDAVQDIDLSQYDLSGLVEHPNQGFHIKLEVHAEGSKGADVKHKTFWVKDCRVKPPKPPHKPPPHNDKPPPPPKHDDKPHGDKAW